jgi:hypothetical protein
VDSDAKLKLSLRLAPADDRPADPVVIDDIIRLIKQAVATVPKDSPAVTAPADGFHPPTGEELRELDTKTQHRIEQASAASRAAVEQRAETAAQPDGDQKLAAEALAAAERVVSAVQRAVLRNVAVRVPDAG